MSATAQIIDSPAAMQSLEFQVKQAFEVHKQLTIFSTALDKAPIERSKLREAFKSKQQVEQIMMGFSDSFLKMFHVFRCNTITTQYGTVRLDEEGNVEYLEAKPGDTLGFSNSLRD